MHKMDPLFCIELLTVNIVFSIIFVGPGEESVRPCVMCIVPDSVVDSIIELSCLV